MPRDSRVSWTITRPRRIGLIARQSALETNSHWSKQHAGLTLFKSEGCSSVSTCDKTSQQQRSQNVFNLCRCVVFRLSRGCSLACSLLS